MKFYKKISFFFLIIVTFQGYAQNTLDNLGLSSSTPAAVAYSLRKLSTSYAGNAIQVRRSSDDTTQDIGFTAGGDLDTVALLAFVSGDNGYVSIWYDQSGNGRDMIKTDYNLQPQVVFTGTLKYIGSKVTIDFSGNKGLVYTGSLNLFSISTVIQSEFPTWPSFHSILDATPRIGGILTNGGTDFWQDVPQLAIWRNGVSKTTSESLSPVDQAMVLSISSQTYNVSQIFIGNYDGGGGGGSILETEAVAFPSLISSNDRLSVECSQGDYYSILTSCNTIITTQPSTVAHYECIGSIATPLTVEASGINLTYQWYSNVIASNSGGTLIIGADSSSFIPPTSLVGTVYYYVEISGLYGAPVTSDVSGEVTTDALPTVSISPASSTIFSGDSIILSASGANTYLWGADINTPLDQVSTYKLAVGLRRLRSGYIGSALRLRRATDNVEANFGFIGAELDIAAISAFLGVSDGYCTILYDQSGFGNNVIQTNVSQQPLFVVNGLNSKPILRFAASGSQSMANSTNFPAPFSVIYTAKQTGPSRGRVLTAVSNNWLLGWWGGSKGQAYFEGWVSPGGGNPSDSNPYVYSGTGTGGTSFIYQNGVLLNTNGGGVTGPNGISLNGSESSDADVAEVFVFGSVLSDIDREVIENSSGTYYGIMGSTPVAGDTFSVSPTVTTTYVVTGSSVNGGCAVSTSTTVTVLDNPNLSNFSSQTKIYFDGSYTITPPSSISTGVFTYTSSNTAVATISGATITIVGTGITTITATQAATATHYSDSIDATLTVNSVSVVTKNGQITTTNANYVNKNGAIGARSGVNLNGESKATMSNGDGLTSASASTSAYQIKQDYPSSADGLYWIKSDDINGGTPFQIYADMTTDGGGWTLIMTNNDSAGWDASNAILRNESSPTISGQYSIISYADYIKRSSSGFQYMIDATSRGRWGGIWTANQAYSFVNTTNANTDITLNIMFDSWSYQGSGVEQIMPWYAPGSCGVITTSSDPNGDWWGTLVSACGWSPVPWMASWNQQPGIIWYWVR